LQTTIVEKAPKKWKKHTKKKNISILGGLGPRPAEARAALKNLRVDITTGREIQ